MTVKEAIKRLARMRSTLRGPYHTEDREALMLGIVAWQEIIAARTYSKGLIPELLPGETKD